MILATGAGGMVGNYISEVYGDNQVHCMDSRTLDVRDARLVMDTVGQIKPNLVIHLAAETDLDRCEQEADHAYRTNVIGTMNVALACQQHGADLAYVSTAGIFDGLKAEPYTEFDEPSPLNVYAKTKLEGEKVVQSLLQRFYIFRTCWLFGGEQKDKKFVGKIVSLCMEKDEVRIVDDTIGNPTYAREFLQRLKSITETGLYGLYHLSNTGSCSRYDVAREISRWLDQNLRIIPVDSALFPLPASRPRSEAIRNYKLELLGLEKMRPWQEALKEYLGNWISRPCAGRASRKNEGG